MPDNNALHIAAKDGNVAEVQAQVSNFDINAKGKNDMTALVWAAHEGHKEVVKLLLTFNPDVNIPDSIDYTALMWSAQKGHIEIVQALLKFDGINVNQVNKYGGFTALAIAASNGHTEIVQAMLKIPDINVNSALIASIGYIEIVQALLKIPGINVNQTSENGWTALIYSASNGYTEIVQALLKVDDININIADSDGNSALVKSAQQGHTEIVHALLKIDGINVNQADSAGNSALVWSAQKGYTEIVQALLKIDGINVNQANEGGLTALMWLAQQGHTEIVQAMLKIDGINVNQADSAGNSALTLSTDNDHTKIVQALLKIDGINVNQAGEDGSTALMWSARKGHIEIVEALLQIDGINVNQVDKGGLTALMWLAEQGCTEIVQAMLKIDGINVNQVTKYGSTALTFSAQKGYTEIVQALLTIDGINVNQADKSGLTALIYSAREGYTEIVHALLKVDGINVNQADSAGNSALTLSTDKDHTEIVRAMLKVPGINVNQAGEDGSTALMGLAQQGHTEIVHSLLKIDGINVNHTNSAGETALVIAASNGHTEIVQALLTIDGINVNQADQDGETALTLSAREGYTKIVQALLKIDGINVNQADKNGSTALMWSAQKGYTEIVQAMLKVDGINVNQINKGGLTALIYSAREGYTEIVQVLLKIDGINVNQADKDGLTALMGSAEKGYTEIVQALLKIDGINVNQADSLNYQGWTALIYSAREGYTEIVQVLLKVDDIDVNQADKDGWTALTHSALFGNTEIVQVLLTIDGINVNQADKNGLTALMGSAEKGYTEIVHSLLKIDGINVNHTNSASYTAVWNASAHGHVEVVKALVAAGADLSIASNYDEKPIDVAKTNEIQEICRNPASCMFCYAAGAGNLIEVQSLVCTIDVNCLGTNGETATFKACAAGHVDVVQFLASQGAEVNIANNEGTHPIDIAAENVHVEILQVLKDHGADLDKSLLMFASKKNLDVVVALLNVGADVSIKDSDGKICLDQFSAKDKIKILTMVQLNLSLLEAHNCALWFVVVQVVETTDSDHFAKLLVMVEILVSNHPTLAAAKDADGRAAVDVASKPMKLIMQSVLLWHGRYRITESRPEHTSATCFVFKGVDEHTIDTETKQPIKVALKLMRLKDQFQREISTRDRDFNNQMIMNVLQQVRPNLSLMATSQVDKGGVYHLSQLGVYSSKPSYRYVEKALVETVYHLRSEDPTKTVQYYRCSKHEHNLSLILSVVPSEDYSHLCDCWKNARYTCRPCSFDICEECFNEEDNHHDIPVESTTWLFTIQNGKDQPEVELARSEAPTMHVFDAVFTNIKVSEGENGTVVVTDVQAAAIIVSPIVTQNNEPDVVVKADATGQLTKTDAEKFYLLVMPLADRNLFVALKQERWAGKNMEEVRHVFVQLVHCVEHMHEKGVLHADLKTLNIVRTTGQWKLIDLDAACVIGKEPVGHKSSSAYVPPEAIYIDEKTVNACVRSVVAVTKGEAAYELLMAHPSFDVWSLGCILYQMVNNDVKPLFQGGQDDNLVGVRKGVDNLFALAEWSSELKAEKLADVPDKLARNLLSQMLHKDPLQRPSLARVLAHSFLSGRKVARLVGEKPKYDIFLSYRVASDSQHVEKLYNLLTAQGFKVYWDKLCLEPGIDWEQGFCEGLVSSRAFVPLLSRDAINHPDKAWQNFSKLAADSKCDNVFLEHRLAVELQGLGLIEKIFPVFIGNLDATTSEYSNYFGSGCHPSLSEVMVTAVEEKLRHHMESQALGTPIVPDRTVVSVVGAITACQGAFIVGPADATFEAAAALIVKMLTDVPITQSPRAGTHVHQALKDTMDVKAMAEEISALKGEVGTLIGKVDSLETENGTLKGKVDTLDAQRENALASLNSGEFATVEAVIAHMKGLLQG